MIKKINKNTHFRFSPFVICKYILASILNLFIYDI